MHDWEDEQIPPLLAKGQPKNAWDDEDEDENDVKESWEDEDEPATAPAPAHPIEKVTKKVDTKPNEKQKNIAGSEGSTSGSRSSREASSTKKSFNYIGLLKAVMRLSMTDIKATDAKDVATSVTAIVNEKLKLEKEANAGKRKTGTKKKKLHVDKPDDDIVVAAYDEIDDDDLM